MKILYLNIRGLTNAPSRLALKRLINSNKPDFILFSEPWLDFINFLATWFHKLGVKLFALNVRHNNSPNLWCICKNDIVPTVLTSSDHHVTFVFSLKPVNFGVSAIYASSCCIQRRRFWSELSSIHSQHLIPWSCIGDFNTIIGAHEYRGNFIPARLPMNEFLEWTYSNNFIHLPTRGAQFTWANGKSGRRYTEKRLDRVICTNPWMDACSSLTVSTLLKNQSDHYPILFYFNQSDKTMPFQFNFRDMWTLHPDCINVVTSCWDQSFTGCPMFILTQNLKLLKT